MKHLHTLALALSLLLVSCATTTPGTTVDTGNAKVSATVAPDKTFSNERFQLYQVSFKNLTDEWLEYDGGMITDNSSIMVLVGDKLASWIEACTLEQKVSEHNTRLALGVIAAAGAAVAVGSNHSQTAGSGAIVALGAVSAGAVMDYQRTLKRIEFQRAFPDRHLFKAFAIPPRKVVQRWILIENPKNEYLKLSFQGKTGDVLNLKM